MTTCHRTFLTKVRKGYACACMYRQHRCTNISQKSFGLISWRGKENGCFYNDQQFCCLNNFFFQVTQKDPQSWLKTSFSNTEKIKFCSSIGKNLRMAEAGIQSHREAVVSSAACSCSCCLADGKMWGTTAPTPAAATVACLLSRTLA